MDYETQIKKQKEIDAYRSKQERRSMTQNDVYDHVKDLERKDTYLGARNANGGYSMMQGSDSDDYDSRFRRNSIRK